MSFTTVITNLGAAKLAQAIGSLNNGGSPLALSYMRIGDGAGQEVTPNPAQVSLVGPVGGTYSLTNFERPSDGQVMCEAVVPAGDGPFTIREVGVYDVTGTLIAVASFPATFKPATTDGTLRELVIRIHLKVSDADAVAIDVDPNIQLVTRDYIDANLKFANGNWRLLPAGGTANFVLVKSTNADGAVTWVDPTTGIQFDLNVVTWETSLTGSLNEVIDFTNAPMSTDGVAIFIDGMRIYPSEYTVTDSTHITLIGTYPAGSAVLAAKNEPASASTYLAKTNLLSEIEDQGADAQETARLNLGVLGAGTISLSTLVDLIHPVGSLAVTSNDVSPAVRFTAIGVSTTWERYAQDRFLLGAGSTYAAGATGGAATHTLTTNNLPSHSHKVNPPQTATTADGAHAHNFVMQQVNIPWSDSRQAFVKDPTSGSQTNGTYATTTEGTHTHNIDIPEFDSGTAGIGSAVNHMPPYIGVYVWRRTA